MPKVSVITAAYNHVKFVRQMIESVQAQTFRDFEHFVVDDGSTDGTADVLKSFGDKITYIRQESRGAQAARNTAIHAASGEYIALLDSDDAWLPNKLERQMRIFEEHPGTGLVYSFAYRIDSEGKLLKDPEILGIPINNPERAFEQLVVGDPIPALTAVFR